MNGVGAGVLIFVLLITGVMGFVMLSSAYEQQYTGALNDPTNNTIDNASINLTKGMTQPINDNLGWIVFVGLLLFVVLMLIAIRGMLV